MKYFKFASVLRADTVGYEAYEYSTDCWEANKYGAVSWIVEFQTYGDGTTQHSNAYGIDRANLLDVVASLAKHLGETEAPEHIEIVHRRWFSEWDSYASLLAAKKVLYKEGKYQWFSKEDFKVSTAPSKRHDKRWEEVPQWADGSVASIYRLISDYNSIGGRSDLLKEYSLYEWIREVCHRVFDMWAESAIFYFDLVKRDDSFDIRHLFTDAMDSIKATVAAFRAAREAKNEQHNLAVRLESMAADKAKAEAAAVAS